MNKEPILLTDVQDELIHIYSCLNNRNYGLAKDVVQKLISTSSAEHLRNLNEKEQNE